MTLPRNFDEEGAPIGYGGAGQGPCVPDALYNRHRDYPYPNEPGVITKEQQLSHEQYAAKLAAERALRSNEVTGQTVNTLAGAVQVGGNHYTANTGFCPKCKCSIQHWDWAQGLGYLEGCATKYIARWKDKGGFKSLGKAVHFVQKIVESAGGRLEWVLYDVNGRKVE